MDSGAYWGERAKEREENWQKKSRKTLEKELVAYYEASLSHIQRNIDALYGRFAKDNALPVEEARKLLTGKEYRTWRMSLEEYVAGIDAGDKMLERELNTLAMRSRISRLDKLFSETLMELDGLGRKVRDRMDGFLGDAYKDNYYRGLHEIGKAGKALPAITQVDGKSVEAVLRTPWSGKNYSTRIWKNHKQLAQVIQDEVVASVHRGDSIQKISQRVADAMDVSLHNAQRLVRTELNYVHNQATLDSIRDADMEFFQFIATLDSRTSDICQDHDGEIYPIAEARIGENVPPLHPRCRSTIAGSLGGVELDDKTRLAKDDDGKYIHVPAEMNYEDFQKVYVEKTQTVDEWKDTRMAAPLLMGGVDCSVKYGHTHAFSLGEDGETTELMDAVAYTTPDLHNFIYPENYDPRLQRIDPETAVKAWAELPEFIRRKAQRTIEFVDYANPVDARWRARYNIEGASFAIGGRKITFFRNDNLLVDQRRIKKAYCHEAAHYLDLRLGKNGKRFSESAEWTKAMQDDTMVSKRAQPTRYAKGRPVEDFAESVYGYALFPSAFAKRYPNRAKIIKRIYGLG